MNLLADWRIALLSSEAEDGVQKEDHSVDDGERSLSHSDVRGFLFQDPVLEVPDRQDSGSDEQDTSNQTEEDVLWERHSVSRDISF